MLNCPPPTCCWLQERLAIMEFDGGLKGDELRYRAVEDACSGCRFRPESLEEIRTQINKENEK